MATIACCIHRTSVIVSGQEYCVIRDNMNYVRQAVARTPSILLLCQQNDEQL